MMQIENKMKPVILCLVSILLPLIFGGESPWTKTEIVDAVIGHTAELPCNVTAETEGDKLNIVAWYKDNSPTAFYSSRDLRVESNDSPASSRMSMVRSDDGQDLLQITPVQPFDAGNYTCRADFVSSPTQHTFLQLRVIEPPQRLWVGHENGSRVTTATMGSNVSENIGPYYVGDTVHLYCVAFGGKPLASLTWLVEGRPVKNSSTPLSELRMRSDLTYGPLRREHRGLVLTCSANNNDLTPPLFIDVIIDMFLGPELVSVRDSEAVGGAGGRVAAGRALRLQCRVLGAVPPPPVVWRLNDHAMQLDLNNVTVEPSQELVVSDVVMPAIPELDEALVTCCAPTRMRTDHQFVCAQPLPLSVTYKPIVKIATDGELVNGTVAVLKGSNVTINCTYTANPPVDTQIWFHEDYAISDEEQHLHPILELVNVKDIDSGEYTCWANNKEGFADSEPVIIDVTYPPYCEDEKIEEYGISDSDYLNLTCKVKGNPAPFEYRWVIVDDTVSTFMADLPHVNRDTKEDTLLYRRPNGTVLSTIFCWGENGVVGAPSPSPCTFRVTDETVPRPPTACVAVNSASGEITVSCNKGHDGGLPQKFKFTVMSIEPVEELVGIVNLEPKFIIERPKAEKYKFVITATNDKGDSDAVEIYNENIVDESAGEGSVVAVENITTLSLSLCGGVLLVALAACGLVLCAHERSTRPPRPTADAPLCAYNTDESNCETCHDSDEGSEFNVRRTESFKRAMSRYPSKNFDVRRNNSFHSARYLHDVPEPESINKCTDMLKHSCRVHSMQSLHRRRDMDVTCDHLLMQLPREPNYQVPKPMNTFYTLPRKIKNKNKHISDEASVITQNSDGFSLPPPPDEFGTYRAASRIRDIPSKSTPTYTTKKKTETEPKYNDVIISPMNTVGLPSISGTHLCNYPGDNNHQGVQRSFLTTFQSDTHID